MICCLNCKNFLNQEHDQLLDKELLLALLKDSDFPDEENLVDIRNVFLKKLGDKVEKLKTTNSQIIRHAYENQLGIKKIHKCCLETIETKDIDSLFRFLCLNHHIIKKTKSLSMSSKYEIYNRKLPYFIKFYFFSDSIPQHVL